MITKNQSIPTRSKKGLSGQDVLWSQFNDISFFIEDAFQENLYFHVLKKVFSEVKFSKIFPLGGKTNVIRKARKSLSNKKKVFIVDNDFDEILGSRELIDNVFYLNRYSIENYALEQNAIFELIKEETPTIRAKDIRSKFSLNEFVNEIQSVFADLAAHFLLINKFDLRINYLKIDPNRDCDFNISPKVMKPATVLSYFHNVELAFRNKKPRLKYTTQLNLLKKNFKLSKALINIPGKYLLNFLKITLKKIFSFTQCTLDSFFYRLMKNCNLTSLNYLQASINLYIKTN